MKLRHLTDYLKERFPPVNMALFAILFGTVYSIVKLHNPTGAFGWHEGLGIIAVISFFFRLRVFDEIKDFEIDRINHSDRVLQSGKIDLRTLIIITSLGFVIELAWSLVMGQYALMGYAAAFLFSLLMRYEFFVSDWLTKRLPVYALTHMLIMPLIIAWIWFAYADSFLLEYFLLAALSVLAGFSFEIARKIHKPQSEEETIDSYSKIFGLKGAMSLMLLLLLLGLGCQFYLLQLIGASMFSYLIISLLYLAILGFYLRQYFSASEKKLRKLELGVSLFMLISYVSIIIEAYL
jgi:4-hydroxybenzoate polyprenyltransferase